VKCATVYSGQVVCPGCGYKPKMSGQAIETRHADLYEVQERKTAAKKEYTKEQKQKWFSMLLDYAKNRGKSEGWVAHTYKSKFGVWPRGLESITTPPDVEVTSYIRHRNIAFAKKMEKQRETRN
jgi:hypothetical protein